MSKAFTRESDDLAIEEVVLPRSFPPAGANRLMTKHGAARFESRLNQLREERRELASGGSGLGGETKAALLRLDAEIQRLQTILASGVIAEPPGDRTRVAFGAFVQVRDGQGEEDTYQIVGVDEANPEEGRISSVSPLARALLSRQVGDKVRFQSPAGPRELTVLKLDY